MKTFSRAMLIVSALLISIPLQVSAIRDDTESIIYDSIYFDDDPCVTASNSSEESSPPQQAGVGGDDLEGHYLPATSGGAGVEEPIDSQGRVPSTGQRVTFHQYASMGPEYRDYYITMRWRYAVWAWNGRSQSGPEDTDWYRQGEPRKVLVTNPATGQSIIAAILESGPAPWTGTAEGSASRNNPPSYWQGYIDGTPQEYSGRVSGFPPTAVSALGMEQWMRGGPDSGNPRGSGHKLLYAWAPDQSATPGPTDLSVGEDTEIVSDDGCAPGGGSGVSPDGFVFPLITTKSEIREDGWCYNNPSNCHHNYNAADIFADPGTTVVAAQPGTVVRAVNQSGGVGSRVVIKGDDGHLYYYTHMTDGSVTLSAGDQVAAGDVLGTVGESAQAAGTPPHLHFDMLPPEYSHRPGCSGAACRSYPFINVQPILIPAFEALPEQ